VASIPQGERIFVALANIIGTIRMGSVGVLVLACFPGLVPAAPPVDVMLITLAVIMATPSLQFSGRMSHIGTDRQIRNTTLDTLP
jgi:anaerobic C4-dicarboxylate transporter